MLWKNDVIYIPPETKAEKSFVCNPILKFRVAQVTLFFSNLEYNGGGQINEVSRFYQDREFLCLIVQNCCA